jgi:hypothetical protein
LLLRRHPAAREALVRYLPKARLNVELEEEICFGLEGLANQDTTTRETLASVLSFVRREEESHENVPNPFRATIENSTFACKFLEVCDESANRVGRGVRNFG